MSENKQQTAVEWLLENLISEPWSEEHFKHNKECWDKAKAMEKEQIIKAFYSGDVEGVFDKDSDDAEQYYNETFKSE